jgi:hypothetical protein
MWVVISGVLVCLLAACGSNHQLIPDSFDRLTAQLVGGDGQPLPGVSVRVEGQDTGVVTDNNGNFELPAGAFPNGPGSENEVSFGQNGVVFGSEEVVPDDAANSGDNFVFDLGPTGGGTGTSGLSGTIYDESTGAALPGVEVAVFSPDGGVYITETDEAGHYEFANLAAGDWQLAAYKDGYYPEMAFVHLNEDESAVQDLALTPRGVIVPGEGLQVKGTLTDAKTGAPVGGATVSMYADTGYMGISDPAVYDDLQPLIEGNSGGAPGERGGSMMMPFYYDPQYQETTTNADGTFEFENEVIGYTIWMSYYADGYLGGSYYQSIDGLTGELDLDLTIEPIIPTSITGHVADETGAPVEGAYVEFIYGMGDCVPLGMDVPGGMDLEQIAQNGEGVRGQGGSTPPPPPMMGGGNGTGGGAGWEDYADANAPGAPPSDSGTGADNTLMQSYLFQHRQGHGASQAEPFTGYYSVTTDADGDFSLADVPVGTYYVFASAYGHVTYNATFEAEEDPAENHLEITLDNIPVGAVEGVVLDEQGEPVPDVLVTCTQPYVDPFTYTDATGHYSIENVPTGQWVISAYKEGYLTVSQQADIAEDATTPVSLVLALYDAPDQETVLVGGRVSDGTNNAGLDGARMIFTPVDNTLGGEYHRDVTTAADGTYSVDLIANGEYNLLIEKDGYQDLYTRIWVDPAWPQMEFMLWPIGAQGGGWGGAVPPRPPADGSNPTEPPDNTAPPSGGDDGAQPL